MRSLTVNETAILKSKFQAGADGHKQKVVLTVRTPTAGVLDSFSMIRVAVPTSGMPVMLVRATLPIVGGGDGRQHIWAIRYLSQAQIFPTPTQVDVENVGVAETTTAGSQLGLANLNGTLWALYRNANTNRWALRSSIDGTVWSAAQTPAPLSAVVPDELCVDLIVVGGVLYLFWTEALASIKYTTTTDGVTWTATVDTGITLGAGWGSPAPRFRVTKTAAYWHLVRFEKPGTSGLIYERRAATPSGWNAAADVQVTGTGNAVFGHEYIAGLDVYARGATEVAIVWADAAEAGATNYVYHASSTDDGATWAASVRESPDPPETKQPSALHVPAFFGLGGSPGQDDAWLVCTDSPSHIHVVTTFVGIINDKAVYGNGIQSTWTETSQDVSDRVLSISLSKDDTSDSAGFNIELANTDGLLNTNDPGATLSAFAQPNVKVEVYQWHGSVANIERTFGGWVDNVQEHSDTQTILLVGRDQAKKMMSNPNGVAPTAPQQFGVAGAVRDMGNWVYLNKTLDEVLNDLLAKANLDSSATGRNWAPTTYVFKELIFSSGTLMQAAKQAAAAAGMRFWFDEDFKANTAPLTGSLGASVWTLESDKDLQTFDTDVSDDQTYTRVRVVGKANIGAKYLAAQFVWDTAATGSAADPRGIAYDSLTGHVWLLCGNKHLYRLNPAADMAVVTDTDLSSWLSYPDSIDVGPDNHLWIADGYDATLGANANRKFRKVDRANPTSTLVGPFTNPDQLHVRLWHDQVNRLYMDTYASPSALVKVNDATGAEVSRVTSPVNFPMGYDSDGQGGSFLTGWEQVDMYQVDLAGNIVNTIRQPAKNSNEFSLDRGDLGLYAVFVEAGTIVKYAVAGAPSSVETATYAEVADLDLEQALLGERRLLIIVDLNATDVAMAYAEARAALLKSRLYTRRISAGAVGNPGLQLHDRVTVAAPSQGVAAGDYMVRSIRSDQIASSGTYLMVVVLEPYIATL